MRGRPKQAAPKRKRPIKCAPAKDFLHKERPTGHFARAFPHPAFGTEKFHPGNPGWNLNSSVIAKRRVWEGSYCNGSATRLFTPHKIANAAAQLARKREVGQGGKPLKCGATETRPAPVTRRASKARSHPKLGRIQSWVASKTHSQHIDVRAVSRPHQKRVRDWLHREPPTRKPPAPSPKAHPKRAASLTLPSYPLRKARCRDSYRPPSSRSTGS